MAFTYGLETNPDVAAKFLKKLTLKSRHEHIALHASHLKPAKNLIPLKDGWAWELLRDAASRPSTTSLLRQFTELFSSGALPRNLWTYLASALMYPFHKKLQE